MNNTEEVRIEWDGPYSLNDIGYIEEKETYTSVSIKLNDSNKDYGIYQVYGHHPVYGNDVLLYIGKADDQTFAKRLSQEGWEYNSDYKNIKFYIGRFFLADNEKHPTLDEWSIMIDKVERMLIYAHSPAVNSSNILTIHRDDNKLKEFYNIRIFNYNCHRSLMKEVSGEMWVKGFDTYNGVYTLDYSNNINI